MEAVIERFRRLHPDVAQVKECFNGFDKNGDGYISMMEFVEGMTKNRDFTEEQAKFAFSCADVNEDDKIDISEFVQLFFPSAKEAIANLRKNFRGPDAVERKFQLWDANKDGKISYEELKESANKDPAKFLTPEDINAIFIVGDVNQDGEIDEAEFKKLMIPSIHDIVCKFRYAYRSVDDVRKAFQSIDSNGDGAIDKGEMHKALTNYKYDFSDQEVDIVFAHGDIDGDGEVTFEEFMYLMCPDTSTVINKFRETYKTIGEVKAAFRKFDKNRDGGLSKEELARMMYSSGLSYTDMEVDAIMNLGDKDGDGEIDIEEFVELMTPAASVTLSKIRMDIKSIDEVKSLFKEIDVDGDGLLSKDEMRCSPGCKFDREQIDAIYEVGDANGDGVLDMGEFIAIMYPAASEAVAKLSGKYPAIDEVKELFKKIDVDNDGSITKEEMMDCAIRFTKHEVDAIFALGDINDDGALDLEEFIGVMYPDASTTAGRLRSRFSDMNRVKKAFAVIDKNQDGKVSKEEMGALDMFNKQEVDALFVLGDSNNDGEIDLEEFIGVLYPMVAQALSKMTKDIKNVEDARFVFKQFDHDGDGLLSQEELRRSGSRFTNAEVEALFAIGDINGDGEIDIDEFINVMCPAATTLIARIKDQFKTVEDMETIFKKMDLNCNGRITREEMIKAGNFNEQEVNAVFDLGDVDCDGEIDLNEFIGVMQTAAPQAYSQGGEDIEVGKVAVYKVGSGPKCVIWCHDCKGHGDRDRTRQLADKLASTGLMVVVPDLFLGKPSLRPEEDNEQKWLETVTEWGSIRDFWVERLLPFLRDQEGVKAYGVMGTGWGSWVATRLSSYGEILACVNVHPLISSAVEAAKEDLYEVLEEVSCPTMMLTCRDNCPNEKPGGLASNVYNASPFGKQCEFEELNMHHGFLVEGDRSVEAVAVAARVTMKRATEFLHKFLHYPGEPVPEVLVEDEHIDFDFDLKKCRNSTCRTCIAIRHSAQKAASRDLGWGIRGF